MMETGLLTQVQAKAIIVLNLNSNLSSPRTIIWVPTGMPRPMKRPTATPLASNHGGFLEDVNGSMKCFRNVL
jgi:hypothetical protein